MINRLKSIGLEMSVCAYLIISCICIATALDADLRDAYIYGGGVYAIAGFLIKYRRIPFTAGGAGSLQNDENKIRYGLRALHDAAETMSVFLFFMLPIFAQMAFVWCFGRAFGL